MKHVSFSYLTDYHTHHDRCGHATGKLCDYVDAAVEKGLPGIGLSDHAPIYHLNHPHPLPHVAMHQSELEFYLQEINELRHQYAATIEVFRGIESDYVDGLGPFFKDLWSNAYLDYVIGSVHWLGTWSIYSDVLPEGWSHEQVYKEFWETTERAILSGAYDFIGHIDGIKIKWNLLDAEIHQETDRALLAAADKGVAVEVNTSAWRKGFTECFPSFSILEVCHDYDVDIVLGSDAHHPKDIAADFSRAKSLLLDLGFSKVCGFAGREKVEIPLA